MLLRGEYSPVDETGAVAGTCGMVFDAAEDTSGFDWGVGDGSESITFFFQMKYPSNTINNKNIINDLIAAI